MILIKYSSFKREIWNTIFVVNIMRSFQTFSNIHLYYMIKIRKIKKRAYSQESIIEMHIQLLQWFAHYVIKYIICKTRFCFYSYFRDIYICIYIHYTKTWFSLNRYVFIDLYDTTNFITIESVLETKLFMHKRTHLHRCHLPDFEKINTKFYLFYRWKFSIFEE